MINRMINASIFFICCWTPLHAQSDFDKTIDSLYFHLPRLALINEIDNLLRTDSTFFNIFYPPVEKHDVSIHAQFCKNSFLHFMPDTSSFRYIIHESDKVFILWELNFYYSDSNSERAANQLKELFNYFENSTFDWEELPDNDHFQGQSYVFYPDKKSVSKKLPRVNLQSNYFPSRNGIKEGQHLVSIFFTEEKI